jgi:hypothetical protein
MWGTSSLWARPPSPKGFGESSPNLLAQAELESGRAKAEEKR